MRNSWSKILSDAERARKNPWQRIKRHRSHSASTSVTKNAKGRRILATEISTIEFWHSSGPKMSHTELECLSTKWWKSAMNMKEKLELGGILSCLCKTRSISHACRRQLMIRSVSVKNLKRLALTMMSTWSKNAARKRSLGTSVHQRLAQSPTSAPSKKHSSQNSSKIRNRKIQPCLNLLSLIKQGQAPNSARTWTNKIKLSTQP